MRRISVGFRLLFQQRNGLRGDPLFPSGKAKSFFCGCFHAYLRNVCMTSFCNIFPHLFNVRGKTVPFLSQDSFRNYCWNTQNGVQYRQVRSLLPEPENLWIEVISGGHWNPSVLLQVSFPQKYFLTTFATYLLQHFMTTAITAKIRPTKKENTERMLQAQWLQYPIMREGSAGCILTEKVICTE